MTVRSNRPLNAETYLDGMPAEFHLSGSGIKGLFDRCNNLFTAVNGDYGMFNFTI